MRGSIGSWPSRPTCPCSNNCLPWSGTGGQSRAAPPANDRATLAIIDVVGEDWMYSFNPLAGAAMHEFESVLTALCENPGRYTRHGRYWEIVAFIDGFDYARSL